jgi:hypothetical protein
MAQHKWHKEIKAWADGALIEKRKESSEWLIAVCPRWEIHEDIEYRIKPQPKEPDFDATEYQRALKKSAQKFKEKIERTYAEVLDKAINELAQPKEPQYLYVYFNERTEKIDFDVIACDLGYLQYIGKIKLENDDAV